MRPFVVTIASEKGGVGKTTLATNLAVYLKALDEDLPVAIASFDNHFSVDNMFAIGTRRGRSVADLFAGVPLDELLCFGEYGVQYLVSERQLAPPDDDIFRLRAALDDGGFDGVFILDTRPVIDYFTRSALAAADLLLIPVKDRPSLINAAAILEAYAAAGGARESAWLVPSLVDARLRLRGEIGVREFLTFSARERGYQVLDTFLAKSPKVESLATNLTSRVYPVLTHARGTLVHRQFRELGDFVLKARGEAGGRGGRGGGELAPGFVRRLLRTCPCCETPLSAGEAVRFFHDLHSRGHGAVHQACLATLCAELGLADYAAADGWLFFDLLRAGFSSDGQTVDCRLFTADGEERAAETFSLDEAPALRCLLQIACRRPGGDFYRDLLSIGAGSAPFELWLGTSRRGDFSRRRRQLWRQVFDGP